MSGSTSTRAKDVCLNFWDEKGEMRTNLCTPFSFLKNPKAYLPSISKVTDFVPILPSGPPPSPNDWLKILTANPLMEQYLWYILKSIEAQSWASWPPAPL